MSEDMVLKPHQKPPIADRSVQHTPPLQTGQSEVSSESDGEEEDEEEAQGGYQLLPQGEEEDERGRDRDSEKEVVVGPTVSASRESPQVLPMAALPVPVVSEEHSKAPLDEGQVGVIKQAMVGFSLPQAAAPEWAKEVPEDVWKEQLLAQLRAAQTGSNTKHSLENESK